MADQKNRGGQKTGNQALDDPERKQGTTTGGTGERAEDNKKRDQQSNPG